MSKRTWISLVCLVLMLGSILGILPVNQANAQSPEELELVDLINALRASRGLSAYIVDPDLMMMAHEHSTFQALIHESTHLHSDGRTPPQIGVVENVAGGDLGWITPETAIYDIWMGDAVHAKTLVGYASGAIGVGIADDGITSYYTLELRPGVGNAGTSTPYTPIALAPLVTMTPLADGTIIHVVGYGQTLWSIAVAYGITVDQIRAWNNMPPDSTDIYAGQKLLVFPASLVTPPLPTQAVTREPASTESGEALAAVVASATSGPTQTLSPTPTLTRAAQEFVSMRDTSTHTGSGPDKPAARESLPAMVVIAIVVMLTGLALLVYVLPRKTSG